MFTFASSVADCGSCLHWRHFELIGYLQREKKVLLYLYKGIVDSSQNVIVNVDVKGVWRGPFVPRY